MDAVKHLNRRNYSRQDFHSTIRFVPIAAKGTPLRRGISQNISSCGVQILTKTVVEQGKILEIYLPIEKNLVVPVWGKAVWMSIEDELADSPYWVRTGLQFSFQESEHKDAFERMMNHSPEQFQELPKQAPMRVNFF